MRLSHRPVHTKGRDGLLLVSPSCLTAGIRQTQVPTTPCPPKWEYINAAYRITYIYVYICNTYYVYIYI